MPTTGGERADRGGFVQAEDPGVYERHEGEKRLGGIPGFAYRARPGCPRTGGRGLLTPLWDRRLCSIDPDERQGDIVCPAALVGQLDQVLAERFEVFFPVGDQRLLQMTVADHP